MMLCVWVCVRINSYIVHKDAMRPCHSRHSMPLTLFLPKGDFSEYVRVCACACVYVIKLRTITHCGLVILVIVYHSH